MIALATALANARLEAIVAYLQVGTGSAAADLYDGGRPTLGGLAPGNLLVSIPLVIPVGTVADGVLTLTPTEEATVLTTGVATWARITNAAGDLAWDCDVTPLGGAGELQLATTTLYAGGQVRIVAGTLG